MKKSLCLVLGICCAVLGCGSKDECSFEDMAFCNDNGTSVNVCENGSWVEKPCEAGLACAYVDGVVQCFGSVSPIKCMVSEQYCENDVVRTCDPSGVWRYESCGTNKTCGGNICVEKTDIPQPQPVAGPEGIVKRQCSADRMSIESVDDKGKVTTKTCLEETGFDTLCEEYSSGHVGCAMPVTCGEKFTAAGECRGSRHVWCDERYITPKPSVEDCAFTGKVCASLNGNADCFESCDTAKPDALFCGKEAGFEIVERCINVGDSNIIEKGVSICLDEKTSAACSEGVAAKTACKADEKCLTSAGRCLTECSKEKLGDFMCSSTGEVMMCSEVEGGYFYASQGKRHCDGDNLIQCIANEITSQYELKDVDCANYRDNDGNTVKARCISNYNYMDDADLCIGDEGGTSCGDLTEEGRCDGNTLKYCDTVWGYAVEKNCANDKYGETSCSVYKKYADCRKPCKKSGAASCTYNTNSESYDLALCAPDDKTNSLTEVWGSSICLGNVLYECNRFGKAVTTDCAANGGRCDENQCVYPACAADSAPICMADDAMISCEISANGMVLGAALQTMTCDLDGNCSVCKNGEAVSVNAQK